MSEYEINVELTLVIAAGNALQAYKYVDSLIDELDAEVIGRHVHKAMKVEE